MRVKSLICHTRRRHGGAFRLITPTPVATEQRNQFRSILREAAPREKTVPEVTPCSVLFLLCFPPGAARRPERGVEQAVVLARIDVGNMRGVAEIGLPVADQIAVTMLADDGQRVDHNEMRIIPVPIG